MTLYLSSIKVTKALLNAIIRMNLEFLSQQQHQGIFQQLFFL